MDTQTLKQLFENKAKADTPCQKVIGSKSNVDRFGMFWKQNHQELAILTAKLVYDYIQDENPSRDELVAFKLSIAKAFSFFAACSLEKEKLQPGNNVNGVPRL